MIHGTTKRNVPLGRLGSDGAPAVHRAQDEADKPAGDEQGLQTTLSRPVEKREAKTPGRMRRGVKTTTNTAKRSPKRVAILKRQREVLAYREMGHSYDKIAAALGISDSQVERDLIAAMDAIIREPAERVFAIDMRRLDEMLAGHYDAACNGDPTATAACLRIIEMRGRMLGFFDHERRARVSEVMQEVARSPWNLSYPRGRGLMLSMLSRNPPQPHLDYPNLHLQPPNLPG